MISLVKYMCIGFLLLVANLSFSQTQTSSEILQLQAQNEQSLLSLNAYNSSASSLQGEINGVSRTSIIQIGDFNTAKISISNNIDLNLSILQEGNNNTLLSFGENRLIKDATIIQSGDNQMIQIYNY